MCAKCPKIISKRFPSKWLTLEARGLELFSTKLESFFLCNHTRKIFKSYLLAFSFDKKYLKNSSEFLSLFFNLKKHIWHQLQLHPRLHFSPTFIIHTARKECGIFLFHLFSFHLSSICFHLFGALWFRRLLLMRMISRDKHRWTELCLFRNVLDESQRRVESYAQQQPSKSDDDTKDIYHLQIIWRSVWSWNADGKNDNAQREEPKSQREWKKNFFTLTCPNVKRAKREIEELRGYTRRRRLISGGI